MSGIAEVLHNLGYQVSGSDMAENAVTQRLHDVGIKIHHGHDGMHVQGADVVVVSTAVKPHNPEVMAARNQAIPVIPRAMMLAELMRLRQGVAVAGTHGKTTTTSLIASTLAEAGMDPTFVIGGQLNSVGAHARLGSGEFLVAEADESDASFLYLQPVIAVVTNIDADHMETYGHDFGKLKQAFVDFIQRLPFYGVAILCADDPQVRAIIPQLNKLVVTYGLSQQAQIRAEDIRHDAGKMHFTLVRASQQKSFSSTVRLPVTLNMPGEHNVANALAAIAVAMEVGAPDAAILKALVEFHGVSRRFQCHGDISMPQGGSFTLIDDYGHHPAEMEATLKAAQGAYPGRPLLLAFQPHRYTRTRDLFEDFVRVLSSVDKLLLTDVYAAGESVIASADGMALAHAIRTRGKVEPRFVATVDEIPAALMQMACSGDVVLTMGAGSIGQVGNRLTQRG
jgi:UDP-N-acetylmuramate--alanine ligase